MNKKKVPEAEDLYPVIGQLIFDTISAEFRTAWMHVEMIDDVSSYGIYYLKPNGRVQVLYNGLEKLEKSFRELRNRFKNAGCEAWTSATFMLSEEGKFFIDYAYDDVSDFGRMPERQAVWVKKYLGDNAAIDLE